MNYNLESIEGLPDYDSDSSSDSTRHWCAVDTKCRLGDHFLHSSLKEYVFCGLSHVMPLYCFFCCCQNYDHGDCHIPAIMIVHTKIRDAKR